jgi:hypothetical protein
MRFIAVSRAATYRRAGIKPICPINLSLSLRTSKQLFKKKYLCKIAIKAF